MWGRQNGPDRPRGGTVRTVCHLGGSGGRIRTSDLWVMSPTSCHCSTPRQSRHSYAPVFVFGDAGRPRRPRLPQRYHCSTLRRCVGSRPGSGWDRVGPTRSRPRAPRIVQHVLTTCSESWICSSSRTGFTAPTTKSSSILTLHYPLTIRTTRLQSVTRCPPVAYQPDRLSGVSRTQRPWDVSS